MLSCLNILEFPPIILFEYLRVSSSYIVWSFTLDCLMFSQRFSPYIYTTDSSLHCIKELDSIITFHRFLLLHCLMSLRFFNVVISFITLW